ncbi:zinc ribbon domain-containing protein [bacterium]|nr:zinc ribbon domain-containing protein [bacterium]
MTLIKCKECGKEISSEAEVCPNCGYQNTGCGTFVMIVLAIITAAILLSLRL